MLFALHVPDHTLSTEISLAAFAMVAFAAVIGLRRYAGKMQPPSLGLFTAVTALVFAVQMVNFPLVGGTTSGHLLGAAAAVLLLGPVCGVATLAIVLVVQALVLGDGGVTALGVNLLNMAILAPTVAFATYHAVRRYRSDTVGTLVAAALAGGASTVVAAVACAVELSMSGVGSFSTTATTLVGHHAWLGLVEGAATAALVVAPSLSTASGRRLHVATLAIAAVVVFALTPLSSELPDTLETVLAAVTVR